jgi:hypothetical protein
MSQDESKIHGDAMHHDDVAECDTLGVSEESESDANCPKETARNTVLRDPVTGKFLAGTKAGPGRPKGRKDRLNVQVIETLEALWTKRGAEIIDQLAAEKPEVVASLIARLIPQQLAEQAITGDDEQKAQGNQEVTIKVVTDQSRDVLPPREVVGELMHDDDGANVTH